MNTYESCKLPLHHHQREEGANATTLGPSFFLLYPPAEETLTHQAPGSVKATYSSTRGSLWRHRVIKGLTCALGPQPRRSCSLEDLQIYLHSVYQVWAHLRQGICQRWRRRDEKWPSQSWSPHTWLYSFGIPLTTGSTHLTQGSRGPWCGQGSGRP